MLCRFSQLYTIGIGPSSSHTVGPMRAVRQFIDAIDISKVKRVKAELFGSLAFTGKGHGTHRAIVAGLAGETPETINPQSMWTIYESASEARRISLDAKRQIEFLVKRDLAFNRRESRPFHPNAMEMTAWDQNDKILKKECYYSVGGGAVKQEFDVEENSATAIDSLPYKFNTAEELISIAKTHKLRISRILLNNEYHLFSKEATHKHLLAVWKAMKQSVQNGLQTEGTLPGGLNVSRRAPGIYKNLTESPESALKDSLSIMDWVNLYAIAVNEENAAGGRVVTAPTNGASGILPAVMMYADRFMELRQGWHRKFLATAGAIGLLFKEHASISGADVGCQGEVGVACSMAAAGLAELMGGSPLQVENAAEIGMEHNLGLTCDPVGGLVQIPCIERNAMGAIKAINAARIAMRGDGSHTVSLDAVIKTMKDTGKDMRRKYKETSRGGLAVNVVEC